MAGRFSVSSSTISSGYSSLADESLNSVEQDWNELNREQLDWCSPDVLLVTKANSSTIVIYSIFKIDENLRCEYYRNENHGAEDSRPSCGTSQILCQKLECNRRKGLLSGLKFYQDFLKNPQKRITVYTDLLRTNIGAKAEGLIQKSVSNVNYLHHHQHEGSSEAHNYNQYFQAARRLLDDDTTGFKNTLLQLGSMEFYRIR